MSLGFATFCQRLATKMTAAFAAKCQPPLTRTAYLRGRGPKPGPLLSLAKLLTLRGTFSAIYGVLHINRSQLMSRTECR